MIFKKKAKEKIEMRKSRLECRLGLGPGRIQSVQTAGCREKCNKQSVWMNRFLFWLDFRFGVGQTGLKPKFLHKFRNFCGNFASPNQVIDLLIVVGVMWRQRRDVRDQFLLE